MILLTCSIHSQFPWPKVAQCNSKVRGVPDVYAVQPMEWTADAEARLKEIPFFVRPAARKKIEKFAQEMGATQITVDVYEQAKQKFG